MKPQILLILILGLITTNPAQALNVQEKESGFIFSSQKMGMNDLFYSAQLISENDWVRTQQSQIFRPTENYASLENYNPVDDNENLEVFQAEVAFLADKNKANDFFMNQESLNILNLMDAGFNHTVITASNVNQTYQNSLSEAYQSALQVLTDKLNRFSDPIDQNQYQNGLSRLDGLYNTLKAKTWCSEPSTSCIQSQVTFDDNLSSLLSTMSSLPMSSMESIPTDIGLYAEVLKTSDLNYGLQSPTLASIPYPAGHSLVQNGFLSNVLIQYTKIVVSVHNYSDSQALIVIQSVIGLEKDDLDAVQSSFLDARTLLMGQSIYNGDEGFTMGLPQLQITMAQKLKSALQ